MSAYQQLQFRLITIRPLKCESVIKSFSAGTHCSSWHLSHRTALPQPQAATGCIFYLFLTVHRTVCRYIYVYVCKEEDIVCFTWNRCVGLTARLWRSAYMSSTKQMCPFGSVQLFHFLIHFSDAAESQNLIVFYYWACTTLFDPSFEHDIHLWFNWGIISQLHIVSLFSFTLCILKCSTSSMNQFQCPVEDSNVN